MFLRWIYQATQVVLKFGNSSDDIAFEIQEIVFIFF